MTPYTNDGIPRDDPRDNQTRIDGQWWDVRELSRFGSPCEVDDCGEIAQFRLTTHEPDGGTGSKMLCLGCLSDAEAAEQEGCRP